MLEQLVEDYITERFHFYPVESTMAGIPGNDDRLGSFSRSDIAGRVAWLTDFRERLNGLRLTELSRTGYLDAIWLMSRLRAELFDLEESRPWKSSPAFYADTIRLAILSLVLQAAPQDHYQALLARLEAIPPLTAHAEENLTGLSPEVISRGLAAISRCRRLLLELPKILEAQEPLPAPRMAELGERSRNAMRALQDLSAMMGSAPPLAKDLRLDEEALSRYWLVQEMVDRPLEEIEARAVKRKGQLLDRITESALADFSGQPVLTVLRSLHREPTQVPVEDARLFEEELREFLLRDPARSLGAPMSMRAVSEALIEPEAVKLWLPIASQPSRGGVVMLRDPLGVGAPVMRRRLLRELGRYLLHRYQAQSGSLIRRVFTTESTVSGWLASLEDSVLEGEFRPADQALRLHRHHARLLDQVRLIASIRYHSRRLDADALERFFAEQALLTSTEAAVEAERVVTELDIGSAGLGELLFEDLFRELERTEPLVSRDSLVARGLPEGLIPIRLLRFTLIPGSSPNLISEGFEVSPEE